MFSSERHAGGPACLPRHAVDAAMAGKTGLVIGCLHDRSIHDSIELVASRTKRLDLEGFAQSPVLAVTGQRERFG